MNFIIFCIYILILAWGFTQLDLKYDIIVKFQNKDNKGFRRLINLFSIASFMSFIILYIVEDDFSSLGINVRYIQWIVGIPLLFRSYIGSRISEIVNARKEELKHRKVEVTFCYYCGSELNGNNICPSCGKEIEL